MRDLSAFFNPWMTGVCKWWITMAVYAWFKDKNIDTHAHFLRKVDFYETWNPFTLLRPLALWQKWSSTRLTYGSDSKCNTYTPTAWFAAPDLENRGKNESKEHFCMCVMASAGCSALSRRTRAGGMCNCAHLGVPPLLVFLLFSLLSEKRGFELWLGILIAFIFPVQVRLVLIWTMV